MSLVMKSHLIKIGNSRGIRIPKVWIEQLGLTEEVELAMQPDRLVVRAARRRRQGWDEQFRAMAQHGDDKLADAETPTEWDKTEWKW